MGRPAGPPTDDPAGVAIDDESDIDEPRPGRDVGEVRHPQHVRRWREEPTVDVIARARRRHVCWTCAPACPDHSCQAHLTHQPRDCAAGDLKALPHHRQSLADRLEPIGIAMIAHGREHRLNGRSSSAWAKYANDEYENAHSRAPMVTPLGLHAVLASRNAQCEFTRWFQKD